MGENVKKLMKKVGKDVRIYPLAKILRAQNAEINDYTRVMDFTFIDAGESLKIGRHCMLTWQVLIEGGAKTFMGDRVFVGPGSKILTSTYKLHGFYAMEFLPEGCGEIDFADITICDDAYIGANSTIMPGTYIGEGAVVGANCFANGKLEPWGIYVGTPCKKIGEREKPSEEKRIKLLTEPQ